MQNKIIIPGEITFVSGLLLISFAIPLMVNAGFGISTISSFPFVLSRIWDQISFGIWNPLFQVGLLILLLFITRRFKSGYFLSIFLSVLFGMSIDLFTHTLSGLPTEFWERILYFVSSFGIMCVGIALMVGSKIPLMVIDTFLNDLTFHFHVTYRRIKTLFDIICVSLSVALSLICLGHLEGVGIGTIIMACITGFGVQAVNTALNRIILIRPWSRRLGDMVQ